MKMGTLMSIACLVFCLNELMANKLESKEIVLSGSNYTIKCLFEVEYPSWTWIYNATYYEDITISGYPEINPIYHAKERIQYDTNNKDLKLSNMTKGDAGEYLCSSAANYPRQSTVYIEVLTPSDWNMTCPGNEYGPFSITTECFPLNDIKAEWIYVLASDGKKVEDVNHISERLTTNGCSTGKVKTISSGFHHFPATFMRKRVHIIFNLTYNASGHVYNFNRTCSSLNYFIAEFCEYEIISMASILAMNIAGLLFGIFVQFGACRQLKGSNSKELIFAITLSTVLALLFLLGCAFSIYVMASGLNFETCAFEVKFFPAFTHMMTAFIIIALFVLTSCIILRKRRKH